MREIDLLLIHPTLGIYIIEVKNWKSLNMINDDNNPFKQVGYYKDILLSFLKDRLGKTSIHINIECRVIFPSINTQEYDIFISKNKYFSNFKNQIFFKDNLSKKSMFKEFFKSSNIVITNNKEFMNIVSYLVDANKIKTLKNKIMPIITKDEIMFFDYKQLSILNGYIEGFWVIRGVAGTGKTIILTKFIQNKIEINNKMKFLVLCFNSKLSSSISSNFDSKYEKNIISFSLFQLFSKIKFNYRKIGIVSKETNFEDNMKLIQGQNGTIEFKVKFRKYLDSNPIDYFLCDETQDMPANIMRVIFEEIHDCIFFIDEAQRFYSYSMNSIADIFQHKDFKNIYMTNRVKHLNNVYRTPSNIAKCAFEILSLDNKLNDYYKKSNYLKDGFSSDINFILEDGSIQIEYSSYKLKKEKLINMIEAIKGDMIILTLTNQTKEELSKLIKSKYKNHSIKVMTFQSVKGLESHNIILYNFESFLTITLEYNESLLYRKVYVILTRSLSNLYLLLNSENNNNNKILKILEIIKRHSLAIGSYEHNKAKEEFNLANLSSEPKIGKNKEFIVSASRLFSIIAGLFNK
jgi:hypothetical protein